ncbi:hypothetical protein [Nocardiopsis sp. FR26]|uniref:hypothetical protein n=1 Tax=Nocardiopsis sp. FR26 TaxID=2605987 RepID=UPI001916456E|nr:hypothetical protein [Nocardiopsis sp. FR26]
MERVAVDPGLWARLLVGAADLSRTMQASLTTLGLLMSPSGSVRNAVAHLVCLTARSRSTISEHLGAAQAGGWLTCLERGGNRAAGATASVYQATVPAEVWHRRKEFLAVFNQEPDQADLPVFPSGSVIPAHDHRGPTSEFAAQKINPSIPREEKSAWTSTPSSTAVPDMDPVIAAVIEELAALTGEPVSPAWAARCVSQIMRHRRVRHPIAYVVKTLQNAAEDGTLEERFLPSKTERPLRHDEPEVSPEAVPEVLAESSTASEARGEAPWDTAGFGKASTWAEQEGVPEHADAMHQTLQTSKVDCENKVPDASDLPQEIYRPGGRVLAGLGHTGARELVRLRQQFAERKRLKEQASPAGREQARLLSAAA